MKTKVILLKDIKGVGKTNSVISVSRGYAANYLVPHGLAKIVSSQYAEKMVGKIKVNEETRKKRAEEEKKILESKQIVFVAKAGEGDKLFGSVTSAEIRDKIKKVFDLDIDKKKIVLDEHIKKLGSYKVTVKLYKTVQAELDVLIEKET
ncbi:MAG: 50S ribosomal protein L9 [Caldisericota bacterium]|nr:50S ribosomal protein L9 [Caldisericota bacterium]